MVTAVINPLIYSRSSANISTYGEEGKNGAGRVWVSVIRGGWHRVDGMMVANKIPTFGLTIYREGEGEIGHFSYTPKSKPRPGRLPDRTVTKLVREHLEAADE